MRKWPEVAHSIQHVHATPTKNIFHFGNPAFEAGNKFNVFNFNSLLSIFLRRTCSLERQYFDFIQSFSIFVYTFSSKKGFLSAQDAGTSATHNLMHVEHTLEKQQ